MLATGLRSRHLRAMKNVPPPATLPSSEPKPDVKKAPPEPRKAVAETGGPAGPEPTRYGDWERGGRCVDF
jgi:hypothetical protein